MSKTGTVGDIAWCQLQGNKEAFLAAVESPTGAAYIFDLSHSVDNSIPRKALPVLSIGPPGDAVLSTLLHVEFVAEHSAENVDDATLIVAHDDWVAMLTFNLRRHRQRAVPNQ